MNILAFYMSSVGYDTANMKVNVREARIKRFDQVLTVMGNRRNLYLIRG